MGRVYHTVDPSPRFVLRFLRPGRGLPRGQKMPNEYKEQERCEAAAGARSPAERGSLRFRNLDAALGAGADSRGRTAWYVERETQVRDIAMRQISRPTHKGGWRNGRRTGLKIPRPQGHGVRFPLCPPDKTPGNGVLFYPRNRRRPLTSNAIFS